MIKKTFIIFSLIMLPLISHAADNSIIDKIDKLYEINATHEEKEQLILLEFHKEFSYYDLLTNAANSCIEEPEIVTSMPEGALDELVTLAGNIQEFYENGTSDYHLLLEQMDNYLTAYGKNNGFITAIAVAFLCFEKTLLIKRNLVQQHVKKHDDDLLLFTIYRERSIESDLEAQLDQGLVPTGTRKDLLLGTLVRKVFKKHGCFSRDLFKNHQLHR